MKTENSHLVMLSFIKKNQMTIEKIINTITYKLKRLIWGPPPFSFGVLPFLQEPALLQEPRRVRLSAGEQGQLLPEPRGQAGPVSGEFLSASESD